MILKSLFGRIYQEYAKFRLVLYIWKEYFEALEVLNHHEFAARSMVPDEQETADGNQEPPEEAETGDAEFLSEAEGEEIDQPRTRFVSCLHSTSQVVFI